MPVPIDLSKSSNVVKNDVVKKTNYDTKITEIENKIPDTSNLATKAALTTVKNEIPDTSSLVKRLIIILKSLKEKVKFLILVI